MLVLDKLNSLRLIVADTPDLQRLRGLHPAAVAAAEPLSTANRLSTADKRRKKRQLGLKRKRGCRSGLRTKLKALGLITPLPSNVRPETKPSVPDEAVRTEGLTLFQPDGSSSLTGDGVVVGPQQKTTHWSQCPQRLACSSDVNMALDRRSAKPHSQPSPPRRPPFGSYGDNKEPRPRSRSPVFPRDARDRDARDTRDRDAREGRDGREGREGREGRDGRDAAREVRPGSHPRDHEYRYRGPEGRDKDLRGPPRDPAYRGGGGAEDHFRRKDEAFREPFRDPWNGRREPEADGRARPEENRRNELYRQYYEELQRRQETERPVDCSVIVVNKTQNREYAETVGRKVHDLGMVVDLIFLNTEVSLTQALEDVGRARTPFAIIITQQHQVHRSCTVNILFGTPQEHRNMPLQDAMVLITHNYDTYKVESREKEREEMVRKAAKMADDVLLREPDRESHPVAVLTSITLLSENRFLTPEELDGLIAYITDKKARLLRNPADTRTAAVLTASAASSHDAVSAALGLASTLSAHPASQTSLSSQTNSNQELQAKILSLFKNRTGMQADVGAPSSAAAQSQDYSSLGGLVPGHNPLRPGMPATPQAAAQGYSAQMGRSLPPAGGQRASNSAFGINLDNPSVQKALDTLSQGGPTLNHLVGAGGVTQQQQQQLQQHHPQQPFSASRPAANMGQGPPMSMYPRHY